MISFAAADLAGQRASKYYNPETGINKDEVKVAARAGWTFGSLFGGGTTAVTKFAGKTALKLGTKAAIAFGAGFVSGVDSDYQAQKLDPNIEKPSIGHAIGVGLGNGGIAAFTTWSIGKLRGEGTVKANCDGENGSAPTRSMSPISTISSATS